jgi:CxxC motif-containing protein
MIEKKMICIACPIGCHLNARQDDEGTVTITGNRCKRGEEYGREELLAPKRVVTATVKVLSQKFRRLPVKTESAIPKELIDELLNRLYQLEIQPPVQIGEPVLENIHDTGINLVATRSIDR